METFISLVSDLIILIFDLTMYMHLTALKKEDRFHKGLMYGGTVAITIAYVVTTYLLHVPYSTSSFICMTVPSFLLFLYLSKYKNARFLVTFCFVDTVTFIIAAVGKLIMVVTGAAGGLISCIAMLILCTGTYIAVRPYCGKYRKLMEQVATGWAPMAVSTVFIYILLVFSAAYPAALISRLEYIPVYLMLCLTILSFYMVFIVLILQKAKLTKANILLKQQQHWHDLAYLDELTQLNNPAAYALKSQELLKLKGTGKACAILIFDIDDFKTVNDTFGHAEGNEVLKKTAALLKSLFSEKNYQLFRIGGDEFAVLAEDISEYAVQQKCREINAMPAREDIHCTYSCGYALVDFAGEDPIQDAFNLADQAMYAAKTAKKKTV